jgi:hypothetical protein
MPISDHGGCTSAVAGLGVVRGLTFWALSLYCHTRGTKVPRTPDWLHEIKYDGYRLRVERHAPLCLTMHHSGLAGVND